MLLLLRNTVFTAETGCEKRPLMDEMYEQSGGAEKPTKKEIKMTDLDDFDETELLDLSKESGNLSYKVNHLDERVTKVEQKVELGAPISQKEPPKESSKTSSTTNILEFM